MEETKINKKYTKVLIGNYNLDNKCFATGSDILISIPLIKVPIKSHFSHYFIKVNDFKIKSKYGWVKEVDSFLLDDFIQEHLISYKLDVNITYTIELMLNSIDKYPNGTPVAATYNMSNPFDKEMILSFHKVFFY